MEEKALLSEGGDSSESNNEKSKLLKGETHLNKEHEMKLKGNLDEE